MKLKTTPKRHLYTLLLLLIQLCLCWQATKAYEQRDTPAISDVRDNAFNASTLPDARDVKSSGNPITVAIYCDSACTQLGCELPNQVIPNPFNTVEGACTQVSSDGMAFLWDTCDAAKGYLYFFEYPQGCNGYQGIEWYPQPNTCINLKNAVPGGHQAYAYVKC